jgi:fructose-bisphosphate aldolase class 1
MGKTENISAAQKIFYHRAKMNSLARNGEYEESMEE